MKVVINDCYGGFGLSDMAYEWLAETYNIPIQDYIEPQRNADGRYTPEPRNDNVILRRTGLLPMGGAYWDTGWTRIDRSDPRIIAAVEALGDAASGRCACLKILEIPDGVDYTIEEYDGWEWVAERHRTWRYAGG